ncbi:MAG: hypothetical protein ACON42_03540 [Flavobacteriaceae bacterium]
MKPKIIWMHYLIIGINILLLLFFNFSCSDSDDEGSLTTYFVYKNLTPENIEIRLFNNQNENYKNYSIEVNGEVTISSVSYGHKNGIGEPFEGVEKIILRFTVNDICIENYFKLKEIKLYDNFKESMYNSSNNTLVYNIDSEEYEQAVNCN